MAFPVFAASRRKDLKNDIGEGWKEYKSGHFIVYYHSDISIQYVKEFNRKCEKYYHTLTGRLGFNRYDFWLWEDRAKVLLYNTKKAYLEGSGRQEWSEASVHVKDRVIRTFYFDENFFDIILPHELTHIVFREFIGCETVAPLWLDEGVACSSEKGNRNRYLLTAKKIIDTGMYLDIDQIERTFRAGKLGPDIFYPISGALVIFLLEGKKTGKTKFVNFCRLLKNGESFYVAMRKAYKLENSEMLKNAFLEYLNTVN